MSNLNNVENLPIIVEAVLEVLKTNQENKSKEKVKEMVRVFKTTPTVRIGDVLRILRVSKNLTMDKLGAILGLSPSYLSRLENNQRRLNMDLIELFAKFYNMTPSELMKDVGHSYYS